MGWMCYYNLAIKLSMRIISRNCFNMTWPYSTCIGDEWRVVTTSKWVFLNNFRPTIFSFMLPGQNLHIEIFLNDSRTNMLKYFHLGLCAVQEIWWRHNIPTRPSVRLLSFTRFWGFEWLESSSTLLQITRCHIKQSFL